MKRMLLLSSVRFLMKNQLNIFGRSFLNFKMAFITTASKGVVDKTYLERDKKFFSEQRMDFEEIDLDDYKNKGTELLDKLRDFELVFLEGGNTYYLIKSIRESGFDKVIRELLSKGVVYSGASAGVCVACPSIEMVTWNHPDKYNYYGVKDFVGMNLIPFLISGHYKPEYKDLLQEKMKWTRYPVKVLTDDQAILVEGDKYTFVGNQEEIKF
jgi:dipeptidase E